MPNHVMIIRLWTASEKGSRDHEISKARDRAGHLTQRFLPIRRVSVRNRTETVPDLCVEYPSTGFLRRARSCPITDFNIAK